MNENPNPPRRHTHAERLLLMEAIADWKATPAPLRQYPTLTALARAFNYTPAAVQNISNQPEVYHRMLQKVAGDALDVAPGILRTLAKAALEGKTYAAKVYLDFVRRTITDASFIGTLHHNDGLNGLLNQVAGDLQDLERFAHALGATPQEAQARLAELRKIEEAVDTPLEPPSEAT